MEKNIKSGKIKYRYLKKKVAKIYIGKNIQLKIHINILEKKTEIVEKIQIVIKIQRQWKKYGDSGKKQSKKQLIGLKNS